MAVSQCTDRVTARETITYSVIEKVAGQHEKTLKGFMSDVFKKEDGQWMKVHQRAVWKRVN